MGNVEFIQRILTLCQNPWKAKVTGVHFGPWVAAQFKFVPDGFVNPSGLNLQTAPPIKNPSRLCRPGFVNGGEGGI